MMAAAVLLASAVQVWAGVRTVPLGEAIRSALENNPAASHAKAVLAKETRIQDNVMSTFMPDISLRASAQPHFSMGSTGYDGMSLSAGADISFTFSGSMINDGRERSISRQKAAIGYETSCSSIRSSVTAAYWNMAVLAAKCDSAEAAYNLAKEQYSSTLEAYRNGAVSELDMKQMEYTLSMAEMDMDSADGNLAIAKEQLKALTGIEEEFTTEPLPDSVMLTFPPADEVFRRYAAGTASIRDAVNNLEAAKAGRDSAKLSAYVPSLTASIGYSYDAQHGRSGRLTAGPGSLSGAISVNIPISPMLPGGRADEAIKNSQDDISIASIELSMAEQSLLKAIQESMLKIVQLQDAITSSMKAEEVSRRTYELARESFESGVSSAFELSNARTEMLKAEMTTIENKASHLLECCTLASKLNIDIAELQAQYGSKEALDA